MSYKIQEFKIRTHFSLGPFTLNMDQLFDIQTQMFIVAGVALASIIISFVLLIISGLLMIKTKRMSMKLEEQERVTQSLLDHQFLSPQIHPQEELGRRGFFKFPMVKQTER
uniref:Uncharacterized protein n=1 Tax=Graphocephala atropunctata TaxID=36148 RepID=A0A1B6LNY4_9HEMI